MQKLLRRAGRPIYGPAPKLEINPTHPLIQALGSKADLDNDAILLLDLAKLQEGDLPEDPASFVRNISAALAKGQTIDGG
jgi:molecular chaperone HtpG